MRQCGPNPRHIYPNPELRRVCFINNVIQNPNIQVGDYTYYDDLDDPTEFEKRVTHHYEFMGDKLIIGKFCSLGQKVEFVMNGIHHRKRAVSTYPFSHMGGGWEASPPSLEELEFKGDTVVGNDVLIEQYARIMPGVHIGDGAVVLAYSVVWKDVPPYQVAGGNPAEILYKRFDDETIDYLLTLKWWDWPAEKIFANMEALTCPDLDLIRNLVE